MKEETTLLFHPGEIYLTQGIQCNFTASETGKMLLRHLAGDWGDLDEFDSKLNDKALKTHNQRILSAYDTDQGKVYIITEYDRSATTILMADEY